MPRAISTSTAICPTSASAIRSKPSIPANNSGAAGLNYYGQDLTLRASYGLSDTERTNADPSGPTFASDGHTDSVNVRGEYRAIGGLTLAFGGEHQWSSYQTQLR